MSELYMKKSSGHGGGREEGREEGRDGGKSLKGRLEANDDEAVTADLQRPLVNFV